MSKDLKKKNYIRFIYSIIDFFATESQLPFDVSSYIKNEARKDSKFVNSKVSKFISKNRKKKSNNRLFLTLSFNGKGTIDDGRLILQLITHEMIDKFLTSSSIDILYNIDPYASIEVISSREIFSMTDYIIILFNVSNCSSIECIISADNITSKLIERDEEGDVLEYHSKLNKNIKLFNENLK